MPSPLTLVGCLENILIGMFFGTGFIVANKIVALIGMLFH